MLRKVEQVATTDATVLITGESGTGKELLRQAIYNISKTQYKTFSKINCAVLPRGGTWLRANFLVKRKGVTGATERENRSFWTCKTEAIIFWRAGRIAILELQAKLHACYRKRRTFGNPRSESEMFVIAATNRDLEKGSREKLFQRRFRIMD